MNINNKSEKTELAELELLSCPLCGGQISSQKYVEAMESLRNKAKKSYDQRLEDQRLQSEKRTKQLMDEQDKELIKLREFYANQNKVLKDEITTANNKQLCELKQSYQEILKKQKQQLEITNKETENSLKKIIEAQRKELESSLEIQRRSKEIGLVEGKKIANKDVDELRNELLQKNVQLLRLNQDVEKLRNQTKHTQPELKGEAGEINLYSMLETGFKDDVFERQKRGISSGDIIQRIRTTSGLLETPIVFDNKESQNITKSDIEKAKRYKIIHKTNYVILVSKNLPKKECGTGVIGEREGILLIDPSVVIAVTAQIRKFLIELSREKLSQKDRNSKEAKMFSFITSSEITGNLNSLSEIYIKMNDLQIKEQKEHQNQWRNEKKFLEEIRQIYIDLTGGIDSIIHG